MHIIRRHIHQMIEKGAISAAIASAVDFSRRNPGNAECFSLIAMAEESAGYIKAAIQSISHAIALSPHEAAYRIMRGRLLLRDNQLGKAIEEIDNLITTTTIDGNSDFIHSAIACRNELLERLASTNGSRPNQVRTKSNSIHAR